MAIKFARNATMKKMRPSPKIIFTSVGLVCTLLEEMGNASLYPVSIRTVKSKAMLHNKM